MFDEAIIKGVTKIVNHRIHRKHIMLDKPVDEYVVRYVLEATYDLMKLWEKKKCSSTKEPTK